MQLGLGHAPPNHKFHRLTLTLQLLVVIDFRESFISTVQDIDITPYKQNLLATNALARAFDFPVSTSPTSPQGHFGPVPWELKDAP